MSSPPLFFFSSGFFLLAPDGAAVAAFRFGAAGVGGLAVSRVSLATWS